MMKKYCLSFIAIAAISLIMISCVAQYRERSLVLHYCTENDTIEDGRIRTHSGFLAFKGVKETDTLRDVFRRKCLENGFDPDTDGIGPNTWQAKDGSLRLPMNAAKIVSSIKNNSNENTMSYQVSWIEDFEKATFFKDSPYNVFKIDLDTPLGDAIAIYPSYVISRSETESGEPAQAKPDDEPVPPAQPESKPEAEPESEPEPKPEEQQKSYRIAFHVPDAKESTNGSALKWKEICVRQGVIAPDEDSVPIELPDMADYENLDLDAADNDANGAKRIGNYKFASCWLVGKTTGWHSGISAKKNMTEANAPFGTELNANAKAVDGSGGSTITLNAPKDEKDVEYHLYGMYDKIFEVEFYVIGDSYESIPSQYVSWSDKPLYSGRIMEGETLSVLNIRTNDSENIRIAQDSLRRTVDAIGTNPIWGLPNGKTYLLLDAWFNPSDSDDMNDPATVSSRCFASGDDDERLKACWDLLDESIKNMRTYDTKGAAEFNPYDDNPNFHVDANDGKVKFYAAYLPASSVEYMFYVVKDFAEEQFEWAPYEFKAIGDDSEVAVHTIEYKMSIIDPDKIKPVPEVTSTKTIAGSTIAGGGSNKLVFKGWRRIDPDSELIKTSRKAEECFDANDDSVKDLLYACACQRMAKKSLVEKNNLYWNKDGFVSPKVSEADLEKPFIYVAVYEYQQSFIDFVTTRPAYANLSVMASAGYAYGDTDTINKLIDGQIELSAGKGWELSVERFKYRYNPALPGVVANGASNKYTRTLGEDSGIKERAIDIHEGAKGDSKSVFSRQDFECAVWWITNPSGYVMPVGFHTKGMGEFSMPAKGSAAGTAPSFTPQSSSSGGS